MVDITNKSDSEKKSQEKRDLGYISHRQYTGCKFKHVRFVTKKFVLSESPNMIPFWHGF